MPDLPTVYTIQASDAPQHTGRLQEILKNLESAGRVGRIQTMNVDDSLKKITGDIGGDDLILIVLTREIETRKEELESHFREFKKLHPGMRVAEIIVDNVPYENSFLAFPTDLRPIRDRDDMDSTWKGIEYNLQDLFPIPDPVSKFDWPRILKIAGMILGLIIAFFVIKGIWGGDNTPPAERAPAQEAIPAPGASEQAVPVPEAR